ncbi:MAG: pentapeptide repeat-containing protein, partial [Brevinema sp.]
QDKVDFQGATLKNCDFTRTEFHKKANFTDTHLTNNTFLFTEFRDKGAFYGATFHDNPVFDSLILKDTSHLYFEHLNPKDNDLSIKQFSLTNTVINGRVNFSLNIIKCFDMKDSTIIGTLTRTNFHPECANWETASILKNEEIKNNNIIRALTYKAFEKKLYEQWLKYGTIYICSEKKKKEIDKHVDLYDIDNKYIFPLSEIEIDDYYKKLRNDLCKLLRRLKTLQREFNIPRTTKIIVNDQKSMLELRFDLISLRLSKWSNNHGQDWGRAIIFTLGSVFICFFMFYIPTSSITSFNWKLVIYLFETGDFSASMVKYLSPIDYTMLSDYMKAESPNVIIKIFGTIWFILGKILTFYGGYQIIKAFRKFEKI